MNKNSITAASLLTPEIVQAVNTYLLARTCAELKRRQVDAVQRAILAEHPLIDALHTPGARITDPQHVYMADDAAWPQFYAECNRRERAAGIKPSDMPDEYCPALCAEDLQVQAENLILDLTAPVMGVSREQLYGENRKRWLELVCGLIINSPGYQPPVIPTP